LFARFPLAGIVIGLFVTTSVAGQAAARGDEPVSIEGERRAEILRLLHERINRNYSAISQCGIKVSSQLVSPAPVGGARQIGESSERMLLILPLRFRNQPWSWQRKWMPTRIERDYAVE
jgi:hypothetical protein